MKGFNARLDQHDTEADVRRWIYVPYDQLSDGIGPLAQEKPSDVGIVLIESSWKGERRPYHKQKLALILANQRHFALEQAKRGVAIRYDTTDRPYSEALERVARELGPLQAMEPSERELRVDLQRLVDDGGLELLEHEGWLTTTEQFEASQKRGPPWRMDAFYRHLRKETGILMEDGKPVGGKYSFDAENREAWDGDPPAPEAPTFPVDEITQEVVDLIRSRFDHHPGTLEPDSLPATAKDAERLWEWAKEHCLANFGPYEDAMSVRSSGLFHTRVSALLNLHRLLPARIVAEVIELDIPLPSKEGFVRQVLGWREFVRHVHHATDGFRQLPDGEASVAGTPGDGGYARWSGEPWPGSEHVDRLDGGAEPSVLESYEPLPAAFWGAPSGLRCLDHVVADVWASGYGHHITRLMVLSNIATLIDTSPRELTDWFWSAYADAYDWVVEPNVLGMGTFALGELMTTKPYVSGAAYINRMSDYCAGCEFDPKIDCPITNLYWAFLARHKKQLDDNPRLRLPLANLSRRDKERRRHDAKVFRWVRDTLNNAATLSPADAPGEPD